MYIHEIFGLASQGKFEEAKERLEIVIRSYASEVSQIPSYPLRYSARILDDVINGKVEKKAAEQLFNALWLHYKGPSSEFEDYLTEAEMAIPQKVSEEFDAVLKKDPKFYMAFIMRANMLVGIINERDKAIEVLSRAILAEPDNPLGYRLRGYLYFWKLDYKQAIQDFNKAIQLNQKDARNYYYKALCLEQLEEYAEESNNLTKAINVEKNEVNLIIYYFVLGRINCFQGHFDDAIRNLNKAIELISKFEDNMPLVYKTFFYSLGDLKLASKYAYRDDEELDEGWMSGTGRGSWFCGYPGIYLLRAYCYFKAKEFEKAIIDLKVVRVIIGSSLCIDILWDSKASAFFTEPTGYRKLPCGGITIKIGERGEKIVSETLNAYFEYLKLDRQMFERINKVFEEGGNYYCVNYYLSLQKYYEAINILIGCDKKMQDLFVEQLKIVEARVSDTKEILKEGYLRKLSAEKKEEITRASEEINKALERLKEREKSKHRLTS